MNRRSFIASVLGLGAGATTIGALALAEEPDFVETFLKSPYRSRYPRVLEVDDNFRRDCKEKLQAKLKQTNTLSSFVFSLCKSLGATKMGHHYLCKHIQTVILKDFEYRKTESLDGWMVAETTYFIAHLS